MGGEGEREGGRLRESGIEREILRDTEIAYECVLDLEFQARSPLGDRINVS